MEAAIPVVILLPGSGPAWSPDGNTIAYLNASSLGISLLDLGTGLVRPLDLPPVHDLDWFWDRPSWGGRASGH